MANDAQRQRLARKLSYLNQSALLFWRMIFNGSARQTDFVNISTWEAPTGGAAPVSYRIYRDSTLTKAIAVVRANKKLRFEDHDRKQGKTYSYFIVSVDQAHRRSAVAKITVPPKRNDE